jgi:hypothetical protein
MKRVLLAGVLGGLAAFVWGAISWAGIHLVDRSWKALRDEAPVVAALRAEASASERAFYALPAPPDLRGESGPDARARHEARMAEGPLAFVVWVPHGVSMEDPKVFGIGLLLCIAIATLCAGLLSLATPVLPTYGRRVLLVSLFGVVAALAGPIAEWNWLLYPLGPAVLGAIDTTLEFVAIALVVAALVKPGAVKVGESAA